MLLKILQVKTMPMYLHDPHLQCDQHCNLFSSFWTEKVCDSTLMEYRRNNQMHGQEKHRSPNASVLTIAHMPTPSWGCHLPAYYTPSTPSSLGSLHDHCNWCTLWGWSPWPAKGMFCTLSTSNWSPDVFRGTKVNCTQETAAHSRAL